DRFIALECLNCYFCFELSRECFLGHLVPLVTMVYILHHCLIFGDHYCVFRDLNQYRSEPLRHLETQYKTLFSTLLKFNFDLNAVNTYNKTLAYLAAENSYVEAIIALHAAGADLDKAENNGATPTFIAAQMGYVEVIKMLHAGGADLNKAMDDGATPTFIAAQNGHVEVIQALYALGADFNQITTEGATPAYVAAQNGHLSVIQFLLEKQLYQPIPLIMKMNQVIESFRRVNASAAVLDRLQTVIDSKQEDSAKKSTFLSLLPEDIAFIMGRNVIMGRNAIVQAFKIHNTSSINQFFSNPKQRFEEIKNPEDKAPIERCFSPKLG
ncbi:MAG: ankyrin repeat domain-containing protein, partial [Candidatus Chromulinivorax sp.]|nr:ankyrin repeat domain-containing protein [Candidatus Chromulinivorax sp.]